MLRCSLRAGGCSGVTHFRIIPAGFNAPLEFLTGFTQKHTHCWKSGFLYISNGNVLWMNNIRYATREEALKREVISFTKSED
jgi:hypothetical protein